MKKICWMLGVLLLAGAFAVHAQSAADEMLKWKQLLDAGAITEEEYQAKKNEVLGLTPAQAPAANQAPATAATPAAPAPSVAPVTTQTSVATTTVSNADVLATIEYLIDDDLEDNKEKIAELAKSLSLQDRQRLYDKYEKSIGGYVVLNLLVGLGIGSFAQGDGRDGVWQLLEEILGVSFIVLGAVNGNSVTTACGYISLVCATVTGIVAPITYSKTRNGTLQSAFGLSDRDISFAPIINPINNQYGLVAKIAL